MRNKGKRLASRCVGLYAPGGLRGALLEYAKAHPPLVINLHWDWAPHAHLAMAYDEKVMPLGELLQAVR